MNDCIFCKISKGEIPSNKVYEDEYVYAFHDLSPQAKVHVLIIPKTHVRDLNEANALSADCVAAIFGAMKKIAVLLGVSESGYRIVSNCGQDACQSVPHLHFHLLGGEKLSENMC